LLELDLGTLQNVLVLPSMRFGLILLIYYSTNRLAL
jgi:hypothetical protein